MTHLEALREALSAQPTSSGGNVVLLATSGPPPAIALLTTSEVALSESGRSVHCVLNPGSTALSRIGGSFSFAITLGSTVLRVEADQAFSSAHGELNVLSGRLRSIRPTKAPPWGTTLEFYQEAESEEVTSHLDRWEKTSSALTTLIALEFDQAEEFRG